MNILTPLKMSARALGALRRHGKRDAAAEKLAREGERVRRLLGRRLDGSDRVDPIPVDPVGADARSRRDDRDSLYLETQLMHDRIELGAADEPITREADHLVSDEFRRLADELRSSWQALAEPPRRRDRAR